MVLIVYALQSFCDAVMGLRQEALDPLWDQIRVGIYARNCRNCQTDAMFRIERHQSAHKMSLF